MNINLLVLFIVLNIVNVILQTSKTLMTVHSTKMGAALANAISYGFYTIVIVYMVCDLPLLAKCLVVGGCNLVGVYIVKLVEEKSRKDKLWKIEATVPTMYHSEIDTLMEEIPHNYIVLSEKHTVFNFYAKTQEESRQIKNTLEKYNAKFFAAECENL